MKKNLFLLGLAVIIAAVAVSCKKDDGDDNNKVKSYLLKSVSFYAEWAGGTESWEFTYDATSKKVTKFDNLWEGAVDKTITYDYGTAGKLILMKGTEVYNTYDLNAAGYVTKEPWSETEWASFEYDANGFLVKGYEHWGDADHLKYEVTITDGNIKQIKTYDDDGVTVKKIKEFTYTIGDNVNGLHQANLIDSEWKPVGNFYGKSSKKLVDYFEYWDPRDASPVKSKSSLEYTFDDKDRATKVVKTLSDNTTETWDYTYYEE